MSRGWSTRVRAATRGSSSVTSAALAACMVARAICGVTAARIPSATARPASPADQPIHWCAAVSANRSQSCSIKLSSACVCLALIAVQPRAEPPNSTIRLTRSGWRAA